MSTPTKSRPGRKPAASVEDDTTRTRNRAAYASLLGVESPTEKCQRGHAAAEHRRYRRDGRPYCMPCTAGTSEGGRP